MRTGKIRVIPGPNVYSYRPVLVMKLYLEELTGRESCEIAGFNERLLALLPGVRTHHCAKGRPGGFVERLEEGTYFGHVVEHAALEMMELVGVGTNHGKTRSAGGRGAYHVVVECQAEKGTEFLLRAAVELVAALVKGEPYPLEEALEEARRIVARTELGPSTRAIVEAAERRGVPWSRVGEGSLIQLGYGRHRRFVEAAMTSSTSAIGVDIASDKELTKTLLAAASIPVPQGVLVASEEEAVEAFSDLGAPVVVKPYDGCQGKGVALNLRTEREVRQAFRAAREYSSRVLVEELLQGRDYRVLVVGGKVTAASERVPAHVVGDGRHTVGELIEFENRNPERGEDHDKSLTKIKVDAAVTELLAKSGLSLEAIPAEGERVLLRECANLSTGGTARDVTALVHPEVARMCERAARIVGLDVCGLDLILDDIAEPPRPAGNGVVEINAAPGLRMHTSPSEGEARDVGRAIIEAVYPPGAPSRIPVISVTGTNGKTTITRMIAHAIAKTGKTVGMTTTDGIYIGGERILKGDTTGPRSARAVLSDPAVDVAVLETARGGIVRGGLAYDWSDVAVLSNIRLDHLGQDNIRSLDDLLYVKSLVAERVKEGGTLILNADDERLASLMDIPRVKRIPKNVVYFSLHPLHVLIRRHLDAGGRALLYDHGWIVEAEGAAYARVCRAADIPATMGGVASYQVANALAALAAGRAYGLSRDAVAAALKTFRAAEHNAGRGNLYRVAEGYVFVDYGHNPDAFEAVGRLAAAWEGRRVTGVVGVPGDRNDEVVEQAGRAAARAFHRLIVKEDKDLRGRRPGEVAELLRRAARDEVPGQECRVIHDETEAVRAAIAEMQPGEVVAVFFEKFEPVSRVLAEHQAAPADRVEELPARPARRVVSVRRTASGRLARA
jgi:cyanophycin synthetase